MIARRIFMLAGAMMCLSACGWPNYQIDTAAIPDNMRALAELSNVGSRKASYELAIKFAQGDGVAKDCRTARRLLSSAASQTGGIVTVYMPPVGDAKTGDILHIDNGPVVPGLPAARLAQKDPDFCREDSK